MLTRRQFIGRGLLGLLAVPLAKFAPALKAVVEPIKKAIPTIWVSPKGNDAWSGLTLETAKRTIAAGAKKLNGLDGGRVFLAPGDYINEHVTMLGNTHIVVDEGVRIMDSRFLYEGDTAIHIETGDLCPSGWPTQIYDR